jgi:Predicted GTPase
MSKKTNVIIIGAAGRDFHNFNTYYRDNDLYNVVGFTAAQIPDIDGRKYPAALAGKLIPKESRFSPKANFRSDQEAGC